MCLLSLVDPDLYQLFRRFKADENVNATVFVVSYLQSLADVCCPP